VRAAPIVAGFALLAAGCQGEEPSSDDPCGLQGVEGSASAGPPGVAFGIEVGDTFEGFALSDCDGARHDTRAIVAGSKLTLVSVGAGWCQPCIEETKRLEAEVFRESCQQGLRVVQVLFEDEQAKPATALFCSRWRDRFGLTFPVLRDPLFETSRYFSNPATEAPLNLLVRPDGEIAARVTGYVEGELPALIESLLPRGDP